MIPRPRTLAARVTLLVLGAVVAATVLLAATRYYLLREAQYGVAERSAESLLEMLEDLLAEQPALWSGELQPIVVRFGRKLSDVHRLTVVNPAGIVVADSHGPPGVPTDQTALLPLLRQPDETQTRYRSGSEHYYRLARSLRGPYDPARRSDVAGVAAIELRLSSIDAAIRRSLATEIALMAMLFLAIGLGIHAVAHRLFVKPLGALAAATGRFAAGDGSARVAISTGDEFEEVGRAFNAMVEARTQLVEDRATAQAVARAKSEFLASMSHEIRTPLNGVVGMSGLLLDTPLSPMQRDYAETLRRSAESLLLIINDILDYSKIEAGQLQLEQAPFDLEVVLKDVADLVAAAAQAKGVELAIRVAPDTPRHVVGDVSRIRQVLTNLAGNAVKFTHAGHVLLEVSCEAPEDGRVRLRFAVQDTGIGIPADKLEHIFERFTQADASTTRRYGGTGLGLAISKQLVELMGGKIRVASELGAGSTFSFRLVLPVAEPPPERAVPTLAGTRALVVDDRAVNRRVLEEQLAGWRMRAGTAASAAEALEALRRAREEADPYEIALLDYQLPDRDGLSLAQELRANPAFAGVVLLMLSSVGVRPAEDGAGPVDAWLVKPVRPSVLYNALVNAVARRAGGRAPPTGPAEPPAAAVLPRLSARVLVAEDNPVNQKVILALLEKLGCRADLASNGSEAVEMLDRFRYDVVLMDCEMPEMDGFQATAEIRRRERDGAGWRRVPIVALTAYAMAGDRERCLAAGMDEYLSKPVRERELATTLASVAGSQPTTAPAAAAPSGEPACDEAGLLAHVGGDSQLAREIVQIYLSNAPGWLDGIRQAVTAADAAGLAHMAHRLNGALSNLAAPAATDAARALETAGRGGDLSDASEGLRRLETELARLQDALRALHARLP